MSLKVEDIKGLIIAVFLLQLTACIVPVFWPLTGTLFLLDDTLPPAETAKCEHFECSSLYSCVGYLRFKFASLKEEIEPFNFHHFLLSFGWRKVTHKRPKGRSLKASVIVKVNRQRAQFKIDVRSSYDGSSLLTMSR